MRLIRFGDPGAERPGILVGDAVVDIRQQFPDAPDIGPAFFAQGWMKRVAAVTDAGVPLTARLGPPWQIPPRSSAFIGP